VVSVRLIDPRLSPAREKGNFSGKKTSSSYDFIYMACCATHTSEIYSDSTNDNATTACCFDDQDMGTLSIKKIYSEIEQYVLIHLAKFVSIHPNSFIPSPTFSPRLKKYKRL